jgi:hypothetical protein
MEIHNAGRVFPFWNWFSGFRKSSEALYFVLDTSRPTTIPQNPQFSKRSRCEKEISKNWFACSHLHGRQCQLWRSKRGDQQDIRGSLTVLSADLRRP